MNVKITCRGFDHSPEIDNHVNKQLAKTVEFLKKERSPVSLEVLIEMHKIHQHHQVTIRLHSPSYKCVAQHEGTDVFAEINEVCDRIYQQVCKQKEEWVDRHKHGCDGECRAEHFEEMEDKDEEEEGE